MVFLGLNIIVIHGQLYAWHADRKRLLLAALPTTSILETKKKLTDEAAHKRGARVQKLILLQEYNMHFRCWIRGRRNTKSHQEREEKYAGLSTLFRREIRRD
jgi:hypothetical protein